jgi:hypothetical protein
VSYNPDHEGIRRFLNSEGMKLVVKHYADRIKDRAEMIAPVGTPWEPDEHVGRYKASFSVEVHTHGGIHHDRAEAIVKNDAPEAVYVEYGEHGREPYHTLLRATLEGNAR